MTRNAEELLVAIRAAVGGEREPISNELRMDDVRRLLADTEMELWYCARVMSGYNELRFARRAAEAAAKKIREAFAAEKYLEGK